jgi:zinc protease
MAGISEGNGEPYLVNRRHFLTVIGTYASIPSCLASAQEKRKTEKPVELPGIPQRRVLPSGLRLIVVEKPEAALVGVSLAVRVGGGDEDPARSGTLHFIEHMVFKGSAAKTPGAFDQLTETLGGEVAARTLRDMTVFETTVAPPNWRPLVAALAELTLRPAFRDEDIAAEKKVVEAEMALELADPLRIGLNNTLRALHLSGEPYGMPLFGEGRVVQKLTADDLQAVHVACYRPARMTLCVVGPVVTAEVEVAAAELFAGPRMSPVVRPLRQTLLVPSSRDGRGHRAGADTAAASRRLTTVVLAWSTPPAADVSTSASLAVLAEILVQGDAGRLGIALLGKQKVGLRVRAEWVPQRCGGLFYIAVTGLARDAGRLETAALDELQRVFEDGFSAAELEAGQRAVLGKIVTEKASVDGLARRLTLYDALDTPGLEDELEKQVPQVRGETLQGLLRTVLHRNLRAVALLGPNPPLPTESAIKGGQR